jgi:hypothetical protein
VECRIDLQVEDPTVRVRVPSTGSEGRRNLPMNSRITTLPVLKSMRCTTVVRRTSKVHFKIQNILLKIGVLTRISCFHERASNPVLLSM